MPGESPGAVVPRTHLRRARRAGLGEAGAATRRRATRLHRRDPVPGIVPKLSATPGALCERVPRPDEHARQVLSALGVSEERQAAPRAKGVVEVGGAAGCTNRPRAGLPAMLASALSSTPPTRAADSAWPRA
jgi:hypothetical protein